MAFLTFSKRWSVLAAALFSLLLCAPAPAEDYVPLEDVTKLERPTICIKRGDGFYLIDWDGQNERLWMDGRFNGSTRFSRDGKYASFIATGGYKHYILELETGRLINMEEWRENNGYEHLYISGAWWFPDGRRLACRGNVKGARVFGDDIYVLDLNKKKLINLTKTPGRDEYWATVSPDGKTIAFNSKPPSEEERAALGIDHFPTHLYTMRSSDGRSVVNLTNSGASYKYPAWSPDGKKIAFQGSGRELQEEGGVGVHLFMINPDGSNLERLTFSKDGAWAMPMDWSADSKWVLYTMEDEEAPGSPRSLYRIHIDTREIVRIRTPSATARWVHAGKSRFLSVDPAGKKKAQWGALKKADSSPNSPTSQDSE